MARRARNDAPDTWHHVMNRGIARRPVFETDEDRRFFLSLLAKEARAGRIEIHAYSLLLTHFHVLVRSVRGELSEALRRVQYRYSRRFNRTRHRDGPLFRGRFLSRHVDSLRYRRQVVTYIHDNPVDAGLVSNPADDEWSSAHHLSRTQRPRWLATDWIDGELERRGGKGVRGQQLHNAFPTRVDADFRNWVERQLQARPRSNDDVALKHAGSPRVVRWAIRKAKLADGTRPWRPVSPANAVERLIQRAKRKLGPLLGLFRLHAKDAWAVLRAGLLRMLSGCTHREIGFRVKRHASTVSRDIRDHAHLRRAVPSYAALADRIAATLITGGRQIG